MLGVGWLQLVPQVRAHFVVAPARHRSHCLRLEMAFQMTMFLSPPSPQNVPRVAARPSLICTHPQHYSRALRHQSRKCATVSSKATCVKNVSTRQGIPPALALLSLSLSLVLALISRCSFSHLFSPKPHTSGQ